MEINYAVSKVTITFLPLPGGEIPPPLALDAIMEELPLPGGPFWFVSTTDGQIKAINMAAVAFIDLPRGKPYEPTEKYKRSIIER